MRPLDPDAAAGARALIVAPHPDDEAFGCGGTLHLMARAGAQVSAVVLASGAGGVTGGASSTEREQESRRCCELLGIEPPVFLRLSSAELRADPPAAGRLIAEAAPTGPDRAPDVLFVPSPLERHATHRAALLAALCSGLGRGPRAAWWGYGVWDALPAVEGVVEVDVGSARSAKTQAMSAHRSQNQQRSLAAGMAARDMSQAIYSRITGDEPRKAVERLLDLTSLAADCAAGCHGVDGVSQVAARVRAWLLARGAEWTDALWPEA